MKDFAAPDLVKEWRRLVNNNASMARDASMIKSFTTSHGVTTAQILLAIHWHSNIPFITIPQFLRQMDNWLLEDEWEAELELAVCITHERPPAYFVYRDLRDDFANSDELRALYKAKQELTAWKDRILS